MKSGSWGLTTGPGLPIPMEIKVLPQYKSLFING
jgi:hypothetical protein